MIPACLHADGAEMYRDDEHFVISWSSAFGAGGASRDCLMSRFPISIVAERHIDDPQESRLKMCVTNSAHQAKVRSGVNKVIAKVVAWSLRCAAEGTGPRRGFYDEEFRAGSSRAKLAGQKLAGGFKRPD